MIHLLLMTLLLVCSCKIEHRIPADDGPSVADRQLTGKVCSPDATGDGLYFGISDGLKPSSRAWLLRIAENKAHLYYPPGNLMFRETQPHVQGQFQGESTKGLGGQSVYLQTRTSGCNLEAQFQIRSADSSSSNFSATLSKVPTENSNEDDAFGIYSDAEYQRESGDLIGRELVLLVNRNGLKGIYTSLEDMIPRPIEGDLTNNKLRFRVTSLQGVEDFDGEIKGPKLSLRRVSTVEKSETYTLGKTDEKFRMFSRNEP